MPPNLHIGRDDCVGGTGMLEPWRDGIISAVWPACIFSDISWLPCPDHENCRIYIPNDELGCIVTIVHARELSRMAIVSNPRNP